jgi:hypothetical protein
LEARKRVLESPVIGEVPFEQQQLALNTAPLPDERYVIARFGLP